MTDHQLAGGNYRQLLELLKQQDSEKKSFARRALFAMHLTGHGDVLLRATPGQIVTLNPEPILIEAGLDASLSSEFCQAFVVPAVTSLIAESTQNCEKSVNCEVAFNHKTGLFHATRRVLTPAQQEYFKLAVE